MSLEPDERFAVRVERRLAGVLSNDETEQLSRLLETSEGARELYFRAVEIHLDLGSDLEEEKHPMARISLNCSCGWNFFLPGTTTGHETTCPSCGQTVRIPGRKPGQDLPMSAGEIAADAQRRQGMMRLALMAGAALLIVVPLVGYLILREPTPQEPAKTEINKKELFSSAPSGSSGGSVPGKKKNDPSDNTQQPPPERKVDNGALIEQHQRAVITNISRINMTGLIAECLRFRSLTGEWEKLQIEMSAIDDKIKFHLNQLANLREQMTPGTYLIPGDQIIGFAQNDFTVMKYRDAAAYLQQWISAWRPSGTLEQLNFIRNGQRLTFYLGISEETPELTALVRSPALGLEGKPADAFVAAHFAMPDDLIKDINGKFDALPPGYRSMLNPTDRKRFEELMIRKKAPEADIEWLKVRILGEAIPSFERDSGQVRAKILELEPKLKENVAGDVIYFKDGRKIEGQVIEQTADFVKIRMRQGSAKFPTSDILRMEPGKGAALEFPAKFAEAMKPATPARKLEKLVPLLAWCIEKNLPLHKEYVGDVILTQDASHEGGRKASNIPKPAGPVVSSPK